MDRKLEEDASLVTSYSYEIGEFNLKTLEVPVSFKLQPKELTQTTGAFLRFGGEKISMERQGTEFVLTHNFEIKDEISPTIIIEDKGVLQFEDQDYLKIYNLKDEIFPSLLVHFDGENSYGGQEPYDYNMKGNILIDSGIIKGRNSFKDIKYIVTVDDKIIKTYQADFVGSGEIEINDNFKIKAGQTLIGKVVATDSLNFIHEYLIRHYIAQDSEIYEQYHENVKIIAPDSTVIYEFDESELY